MGRNDGHHHNQHHHQHKSSSHSRGSSSSSGSKHYHRSSHQHRSTSSSSSSNSYPHMRTNNETQSPFDNKQYQHHQQQNFPNPIQFSQYASTPPGQMLQDFNPIFNPQAALQQMCFNQQQQHYPIAETININQQQNFAQFHANLNQPNLLNEPPNWINQITLNSSNQNVISSPVTQSLEHIPANPLDRLQLPANQITETGIIPNIPYYELPAGLVVPLIKPSQRQYEPLDTKDLRLPLPKFPDENFLKTIDSYYASDGKKRDNDGWDREFIDNWIKQKETTE